MAGYAHEWSAAKDEGARVVWHAQPVAYVGDGSVSAVRRVQTDENKKPIAGSEHDIAADLVLLAVGQAKLGDLIGGLDGVETQWGRIVTDAHGATGCAGVWAGGDCRNGGKEVVNAVAEGRDAAHSIHAYLTGGS